MGSKQITKGNSRSLIVYHDLADTANSVESQFRQSRILSLCDAVGFLITYKNKWVLMRRPPEDTVASIQLVVSEFLVTLQHSTLVLQFGTHILCKKHVYLARVATADMLA